MQYPDDVEWIDVTRVGDTYQRQVSLCGRFKRHRELIPGLPHKHFEAELPWIDGTPGPKALEPRRVPDNPVITPTKHSSDTDFRELCIAVAQLAHSCQKLGLTSVKLQMNPTDFMSIKQHSLACGQDLYGMHSELHTNERKLATIPVEVKW